MDWLFTCDSQEKSEDSPFGEDSKEIRTPENLKELSSSKISPDSEWMFNKSFSTPDTPVNLTASFGSPQATCSSDNHSNTDSSTKRGRKSVVSLFPDIVKKTDEFIKEHGYKADLKRRCDTARSSGVTLQQIKNKLLDDIPGLKDHGLHESTVHRLLAPPNEKFKAASKYTSHVDARVASKLNEERVEDENSQYYASRVRYAMEFCSKYSKECTAMSCDNKNKIHIGTQAVSRYHQLRKVYPSSDKPNFSDHDFPYPGYLITPCGYMFLQAKPGQNYTDIVKDNLDRDHYVTYRTGPINIVNRVASFHKSTIESHMNDLYPLLIEQKQQNKSIAVLITDNGPDWTVNSLTNIFFLYRLWKDCKLDGLVVTSYCPGYSAFNPIEHAWSPLSDALAGVVLPASLPGENKPPCQQNLKGDILKQKEGAVFDAAMEKLNEYWNTITYDGFQVKSSYQSCLSESSPYNDHSNIHSLLSKSAKQIQESPDILLELKTCMKHIHRRLHCLAILKCHSRTCLHCSSNHTTAKCAMDLLRKFGGLPPPVPDQEHPGHFQTFTDVCRQKEMVLEDVHMPKYQKLNLGKCDSCPNYCFTSITEKDKHRKLFHSR